MKETSIETIMVVGCGVMGRGIAAVFAGGGIPTVIYDPNVDPATPVPQGVRLVGTLPDEVPDLVVEAVYEEIEIKRTVFRALEEVYGDRPIFASNTSGLPLEDIAIVLAHPQRFLGMHFFTPAEVSPLVEVVRTKKTFDSAVRKATAALARAGKEAIVLAHPIVGYLWNRLQHAILHEAYHLIETGTVKAEDIDKVAKRLLGPRFCVTGLLEGKDINNLEPHMRAQYSIVPHLNHTKEPCAILGRKLERREFGVRSGRGFYDWSGRDADGVVASAKRRLEKLSTFLENELPKGEPDFSPRASLPPD
ncbi:3-hydroxyacyl-CoA dehydrogenase NAD-binding domain-containing protein [Shumkonia mesophila]|uniref:3-hydroxyacyl-CoA dehydrogenase NAD-binding domain-containing protein n=1 Tax=Shumkonia mesophila TaxID=2838854 RepID=UPI0029351E83|nr:3-hydroxyacyl-CoA dehydrogenase NAD-binding domain-containing protein [Shumkonia mesophila]